MEEHFVGRVATKAIIVKDGKVLIVRDHRDNALWELPGGRINVGESISDALKREILEELGVSIEIGSFVHSEQSMHINQGSSHLFVIFTAILTDPNQLFRVPSEGLTEMRWIDKDAMKDIEF